MVTITIVCDDCKRSELSATNITTDDARKDLSYMIDTIGWVVNDLNSLCTKCVNKDFEWSPTNDEVIAVWSYYLYKDKVSITTYDAIDSIDYQFTVAKIPEDFDFKNPEVYDVSYWENMIDEGYIVSYKEFNK